MNKDLYPFIFKRKSFHTFKNTKTRQPYSKDYHITEEEYEDIERVFKTFKPLYPDIKVKMRIAENGETSCRRGQEKVILLYSEEKDNYLMNIGYLGEQLDLYLASKNIGALWFGLNIARMPDYEDLKYVIMIAICKVPETSFRKDMFKSKRKDLGEVWQSDRLTGIGNIVRFAPSACNTQPWIVKDNGNLLQVYRHQGPKKWVMPIEGVIHYNHIDIGIFLCFLDLCLLQNGIGFERKLYIDDKNEVMNLVAEYEMRPSL